MITTLPCGCCPTKPIYKTYTLKSRLLSGNVIFFDDPKCVEHDNGTGITGFMIYHKREVHLVVFEFDEQTDACADIDNAVEQLKAFDKQGFEFSYAKGRLEIEGNTKRIHFSSC